CLCWLAGSRVPPLQQLSARRIRSSCRPEHASWRSAVPAAAARIRRSAERGKSIAPERAGQLRCGGRCAVLVVGGGGGGSRVVPVSIRTSIDRCRPPRWAPLSLNRQGASFGTIADKLGKPGQRISIESGAGEGASNVERHILQASTDLHDSPTDQWQSEGCIG